MESGSRRPEVRQPFRPPGLVAVIGTRLRTVVVVVVPLVLGIADGIAAHRAERTTDGRAFKPTATLMTNNAPEGCAAQAADDGPGLSVGAGGAGDAGNGQGKSSEFSEFGFHWFD